MISRLWKPWFVYRPSQLVRRAMTSAMPPARGYVPLRTSWGGDVIADPVTLLDSRGTASQLSISVNECPSLGRMDIFSLCNEYGQTFVRHSAS